MPSRATNRAFIRYAASSVSRYIPVQTKGQPVVPILPVELVESLLTPPGPMPVEQHDGNFGAIVKTPPLAVGIAWKRRC